MWIQVPIMIVPAWDLRPKAIGRSQVPEYDGSTTSPLMAQQGVSCILQRPLCAYSNGIQQPPFCRPTGGPDGFDSHGSSTPHLTYVAAWDQPPTTQVAGHVRGRKFDWPPGHACAARWPWNLCPDDMGRRLTRKPIDAAPRVRFKSTRTLPQRVTPTAFGTTGRLGLPSTPAAPPGALARPRPATSQMERQSPGRKANGRGQYCRQLDSDSSDTLAHLAQDRHAAQAPVVQRKPGEGTPPETRAPCRQSRAARNPQTAAARAPLPRGRIPYWPEPSLTRTDLYRTWRYRASPTQASATRAQPHPVLTTEPGQPRTGCSPYVTLGAAPPTRAGAARADSDIDPARG